MNFDLENLGPIQITFNREVTRSVWSKRDSVTSCDSLNLKIWYEKFLVVKRLTIKNQTIQMTLIFFFNSVISTRESSLLRFLLRSYSAPITDLLVLLLFARFDVYSSSRTISESSSIVWIFPVLSRIPFSSSISFIAPGKNSESRVWTIVNK